MSIGVVITPEFILNLFQDLSFTAIDMEDSDPLANGQNDKNRFYKASTIYSP